MTSVLHLEDADRVEALEAFNRAEAAATRPAELASVTPRPVTRIGIVGGGTMGAGIAVAMLNGGLPVHMVERDEESVARGRSNVESILDRDVARGRMNRADHARRIAAFSAGGAYEALADADLVIEAVFEDLAVKRDVFSKLTLTCAPGSILATNTSYLNPELIFEGLPEEDRFIGLHFFSPANIMMLLEIVPTRITAPDVLAAGFALADRCGKIPVRSGICDGFIGNRILKLMRSQAERILISGSTPGEVDAAMRSFGMAMGPFEAQDLAGLDIAAYQRRAARARGEEPFSPVGDLIVEAGRLGRKTAAGWYDYEGGKKLEYCPEAVGHAIKSAQERLSLPQMPWQPEEIVEAILFPMINEGAKIVEEGITRRPSDIDLVEVHGYGFPRHRGGLLEFGRAFGFDKILRRLQALHEHGIAEPPCRLLGTWARLGIASPV